MPGKTIGPALVEGSHKPMGATRSEVLETLVGAANGMTVVEMSDVIGGHPNRARSHLDALVKEGLANSGSVPCGRGRPATHYHASARGRAIINGYSRADYQGLANAFTRFLMAHPSCVSPEEIGQLWSEDFPAPLTGSDGPVVDRLAEVLAGMGFSPQAEQADSLVLRTCPFVVEARRNPEIICMIHQGLISGIAGRWSASVKLIPFAGPGICRVQVDSQPANPGQ